MKKMRKTLLAVIMVVVSVSMLSTASFAWFSMNRQVSATNMEVNVVAPGNILIAKNTEGVDKAGPEASADATTNTLSAVSTVNGVDFFFADPSAVELDGSIKSEASVPYVAYTALDLQNKYKYAGTVVGYIDYVFTIYNTTSQDVKVVPTMDFKHANTNANLIKGMRGAIFAGDPSADTLVYLNGGVGATLSGVDSTTTTKGYEGVAKPISLTKNGGSQKVTIRVWIDGCEPTITRAAITEDAGEFQFSAKFEMAN